MRLLFVGDVMLGRLVNDILAITEDPSFPWGDTRSFFKEGDLNFCNLECVLTDKGEPWTKTPKTFHFQSDPENIDVLKTAKMEVVSLANNHVLDHGEEGLLGMLKTLEKNQINYIGAGKNIFDAEKPVIKEKGGIKIGLFAFTDNEPFWEADADKPGINYMPIDASDGRVLHLVDEIQKYRGDLDLIVASIHWGPNWGQEVPEQHRVFARHLIDAGVDVIVGHSPHVFRGIEIYKNRPILYSLGDFIDDYLVDEAERNDLSFIYTIQIENKLMTKLLLYSTFIVDMHASIASGEIADIISSKMIDLSGRFGTKTEWDAYNNVLSISLLQ